MSGFNSKQPFAPRMANPPLHQIVRWCSGFDIWYAELKDDGTAAEPTMPEQ